MPPSTRTRADDVRALAGAIALGSGAGLVIGAAYLASSGNKAAPRPVPAASGPLQAAAGGAVQLGGARPAAVSIVTAAATSPSPAMDRPGVALRDRFRVAALPFRFQQIADAPTDLRCLTEAVYFEARGEAPEGQQAVAQVVLNRVRHPAFPKTICAVVHQRTGANCQFTFACSASQAALNSVAWRRAETIASSEMHGAVMKAVGDATHFQAARAGPFSGLMKVAQIGAHIFYRFGGHAGAPAMFHQTPGTSSEPGKIEVARMDQPAMTETAAAAPGDRRIRVTLYPAAAMLLATSAKVEATAVKLAATAPAAKAAPAAPVRAAPLPSPVAAQATTPPPVQTAPLVKPAVISVALAQS